MPPVTRPTIETRYHQMFPILQPAEIERLRRFGTTRTYGAGERVVTAGEPSPGMIVVLRGELAVTQHNVLGRDQPIVTHGPGGFMGELAQLSGRPSLVDARAVTPLEALVIPSDAAPRRPGRGGRARRAHHAGAHPPPRRPPRKYRHRTRDRRACQRRQRDPARRIPRAERPPARHARPHNRQLCSRPCSTGSTSSRRRFRSCSAATERCCGTRPRASSRAASGSSARSTRARSTTWRSSAPGPRVSPPPSTPPPKGCRSSCSTRGRSAARPGRRRASRTTLGFPTGISGMALMARAFNQAQKFGAEMAIPDEIVRLECPGITMALGFSCISPRRSGCACAAVVIASGAHYRRLDLANLDDFEGSAVHYWASPLEAKLCARPGGGARRRRQLRRSGRRVPGESGREGVARSCAARAFEPTMSRYLVDRIGALPNVEVLLETEVVGLEGKPGALEAVRWRHRRSGRETRRQLRHLFLFIGADPNTGWLSKSDVALDAKGLHPHRRRSRPGAPRARNQPRRHLRDRRRPRRLDQARRRRRRRRRAGGRGAPRVSRRPRGRAPVRVGLRRRSHG